MMWPRTVILFSIVNFYLVFGTQYKVFDVTTVFDISKLDVNSTSDVPGRVHSRTNALGLPFYKPFYNGFDLQGRSVKPNITCDSIENICNWSFKSWVQTPSSLPTYGNIQKEKFLSLEKYIKIAFKNMQDDGNSDVSLYLSAEPTFDTCTGYHDFKISHALGDIYKVNHRFCNCNGGYGEIIHEFYKYGYQYVRCTSYDEHLFINDTLIELRPESTIISLWNNFKELKAWDNDFYINYLYIKGDYSNLMKLYAQSYTGHAYVSSNNSSEMVSPVINVEEEKLCLTIVLHVSSPIKESVLDIFSEDLTEERHWLHTIKGVGAGWNIKHVYVNVTGSNRGPIKLVIKKTDLTEVKMSRISSCSPDGSEVEVIPPVKFQFGTAPQEIATATAYGIEPADIQVMNGSTPCWNGGVLVSDGCACPPGFYGTSCQSGCGKNRFGQDCGGLCSLRKKECQGLMMCTYSTGCHCAPGYEGPNCMKECSYGYYGNNCKQECGHCGGLWPYCDTYTGECSSCDFGYLPPYCEQESVYYPWPPQLTSLEYGTVTVSFDPSEYQTIDGPPQLYQIQYREKSNEWTTFITKKYEISILELISEKIVGLEDGVLYEIRVLFMDQDFNKYDGHLVGVAEIVTKCDIPDEYNYSVKYESDTSSLNFSWNYVNTSSHACPVQQYEVSWKEDWQWLTENTTEEQFSVNNLLPGSTIQFKVRAKTSGGFAPYSDTITASTQLTGLSSVRSLYAFARMSSTLKVSWEPPKGTEDAQLKYRVSYKCVDRPACSSGCQEVGEGQQTAQDTEITLSHLLPFTQYMVTVTPEDGLPASIYVGTADIVPMERPIESTQRPSRSNTSLTVYWDEVPVCSSFLLGYNYQLTKESESLKILDSGFTKNTSATFHNLTASTQYVVKVFITTLAGWNPESYLAINVSTSATVPEAVRNLTIYKRGRGMLGLRWAEPRALYGQLKSFTVTHSLGQDVSSHTIEPSHCVVWPDLYCHTIEALKYNRRYNITVSARNAEVAEDGEGAVISGVTKESPPSTPENLIVTNRSTTSVELEWDYPNIANGVIRSFLIEVEETEKYDQETCCQIHPFVEESVKEELKTYTAEVSGLQPASTYFVSVSAKTVGRGPAQSLVISTRPPHLPFTSLPRVQVPDDSWLPQDKLPEVNNSEVYSSLIKTHLLLAVLNETQPLQVAPMSGITDPKLDSLLQQKIGKPFYFIAEYNEDDVVEVSGLLEDSDSTWGRPPTSLPPVVRYQLIATQVLEYNGVYNVDLRYSQPFTLAYR